MDQIVNWILDHWGFCVFVLTCIIQITPVIKWNPITSLLVWAGRMINKDVMQEVKEVKQQSLPGALFSFVFVAAGFLSNCIVMMSNDIISKKCNKLKAEYDGLLFDDKMEEEIWLYFEETYNYAKNHYMMADAYDVTKPLNRYKVAAAFIIAILKAKPLKKADQRYYKESPDKWIFNETLALYVGLSIIRCYIMNDIHNSSYLSDEQRQLLKERFYDQIPLTFANKHRWECELYFLRHEGCYNLLALSHELEDYVTIACSSA